MKTAIKPDSHSAMEQSKLPQPSTSTTLLIINPAEIQQDSSLKYRINFKTNQAAAQSVEMYVRTGQSAGEGPE